MQCMDMAAMTSGGVLVGHSNAYFGHVRNLIEPQRARNMGEGWETARRVSCDSNCTHIVNGTVVF